MGAKLIACKIAVRRTRAGSDHAVLGSTLDGRREMSARGDVGSGTRLGPMGAAGQSSGWGAVADAARLGAASQAALTGAVCRAARTGAVCRAARIGAVAGTDALATSAAGGQRRRPEACRGGSPCSGRRYRQRAA